MRARVLIPLGLGVFLSSALVGAWVAVTWLSPEPLRRESERILSKLLRTEVSVTEVRPRLFDGVGLDGRDVELYQTSLGPALRAEHVEARFRPLSLLMGRPRLSRLSVDGVRLRIERSAEGRYRPEFLARFDPEPPGAEPSQPEELLSPLIALEVAARWLLGTPRVADHVEVRRGEVLFGDARVGRRAATLALSGVVGHVRHSRLGGDAKLRVRARFAGDEGTRSSVEWEGRRDRNGSLRFAMATSDLQLAAIAPWLRPLHPEPLVAGGLSGVLIFETREPGRGRLEVDLVGRGVRSAFGADPGAVEGETFGPIRAERVELRAALEIDPQRVRLENARLASRRLSVEAEGTVERPLRPDSGAQLSVAVREADVDAVRHAIGWLPEVEREEAAGLVRPVESGRLVVLRVGGEATLSRWQDFLAGRTHRAPRDWVVDAQVADALVRVGEDDVVEELSGRIWWSSDRLEIRGARALLDGEPLPRLDVTLDGVTNFFVVDPSRRALRSGALPLVGLRPLWEVFFASDDPEPPRMTAPIEIHLDLLEHPMFLWPIRDLRAAIEPTLGGVHILTGGGTWAGVPVRGDADWIFEPAEAVRVRLTASRPGPPPAAPEPGGPAVDIPWARGRFAVGEMTEGSWRQRGARGSFTATAGEVEIQQATIELLPSGRIDATGAVDLSQPDEVALGFDFALVGGDVSALVRAAGLPEELASGRTDAGGTFRGTVRPDAPLFADLRGRLGVAASGGRIRRAVPAVVAVALASQSVNPFARREAIRYDRLETLVEFEDGAMKSDSLTIDGPDVRAFASGSIELVEEPHPIDVRIVLYLFRQIDNVIGKIPLVNLLLLGPDDSLGAAYYELKGPWEDPQAKPIALESIAASMPGSSVFENLQAFVQKGIDVIEAMLPRSPSKAPEPSLELAPVPPASTPGGS